MLSITERKHTLAACLFSLVIFSCWPCQGPHNDPGWAGVAFDIMVLHTPEWSVYVISSFILHNTPVHLWPGQHHVKHTHTTINRNICGRSHRSLAVAYSHAAAKSWFNSNPGSLRYVLSLYPCVYCRSRLPTKKNAPSIVCTCGPWSSGCSFLSAVAVSREQTNMIDSYIQGWNH